MRKTLEEELGFEKELGQFVRIFPTYSEQHGCDLYIARCPYCTKPLNIMQQMFGLSVPIDGDALIFLFCSACIKDIDHDTDKNYTATLERSWVNLSNYHAGQRPYAVITKGGLAGRTLTRALHCGFYLPVVGKKQEKIPVAFVLSILGVVLFLDITGGVA